LTDAMPLGYLDRTVASPVRVSEADVERLAALVGVAIGPADQGAVALALGVLLTATQLVSEFALTDDVEAAPVFRP
jgi:hypothetical protein